MDNQETVVTTFGQINLWAPGDYEFNQRTGKKFIKPPFPAFCSPRKIDELEEQRAILKGRLGASHETAFGESVPLLDETAKARTRAEVRNIENRIDVIGQSKQTPKGPLLDELVQIYKEIGDDISGAMFSKTAQREGYADPHEELRRMKSKLIPVSNIVVKWVKKCNQFDKVVDKKMDRSTLEICWKILGHFIGRETNTEHLRPDDPYDTRYTKKDVMAAQG